jgi:hypothetical protein
VKYYGQSRSDAERSNIKYHKVGDFPLVQLRKNEIKRPIVRTNSVRIAPPSKIVLNPEARMSILRSNSFQMSGNVPKLIPVKMKAKDDAHEIITNHEPISDITYPASSKSVLDALEKNCRKRINNEELTLDRNKKFCTVTAPTEVVDSPKKADSIPATPLSGKRTREDSPIKGAQTSDSLVQLTKKNRTKNNALLSSLSSSNYQLIMPRSASLTPYSSARSTLSDKPFKKTSDETILSPIASFESFPMATNISDSELVANKKLQLFNRNSEEKNELNAGRAESQQIVSNKADKKDEEDEEDLNIKFIKPKELASENYDATQGVENELLAKMLHGLGKGFQSPIKDTVSKDVVDKPKNEESAKLSAAISFNTTTTTSSIAPITSHSLVIPVNILSNSEAKSTVKLPEIQKTVEITKNSESGKKFF